jgi:transposase-like protein
MQNQQVAAPLGVQSSRRFTSMGGFKSFGSAAITLAGIELAHRIRKRQFSLGRGRYRNFGSLKQIWERALA